MVTENTSKRKTHNLNEFCESNIVKRDKFLFVIGNSPYCHFGTPNLCKMALKVHFWSDIGKTKTIDEEIRYLLCLTFFLWGLRSFSGSKWTWARKPNLNLLRNWDLAILQWFKRTFLVGLRQNKAQKSRKYVHICS